MRDFIVIVFNFEVFHMKFSEKYKVPQKNIYMQNAEAYEETVIRLIGLGMDRIRYS